MQVEETASSLGMRVLGWRRVPTDNSTLGDGAKATEPIIEQVFFNEDESNDKMDLELQCYVLRKLIESDVSIPTASTSTKTLQ